PDMAVWRIRRHTGLAVGGASGLAGEVLRRWLPREAAASGDAGLLHAFPAVVTAEAAASPESGAGASVPAARVGASSPLIQPALSKGGGSPLGVNVPPRDSLGAPASSPALTVLRDPAGEPPALPGTPTRPLPAPPPPTRAGRPVSTGEAPHSEPSGTGGASGGGGPVARTLRRSLAEGPAEGSPAVPVVHALGIHSPVQSAGAPDRAD